MQLRLYNNAAGVQLGRNLHGCDDGIVAECQENTVVNAGCPAIFLEIGSARHGFGQHTRMRAHSDGQIV